MKSMRFIFWVGFVAIIAYLTAAQSNDWDEDEESEGKSNLSHE